MALGQTPAIDPSLSVQNQTLAPNAKGQPVAPGSLVAIYGTNFASALAEARGKAQADALRKTRRATPAFRVHEDGRVEETASTALKAGDADASLDLQAVPNRVYDESTLEGEIYDSPPEPPLSPEDAAWAAQFVPPRS